VPVTAAFHSYVALLDKRSTWSSHSFDQSRWSF